eukprot:11596739-Ditylum_brightwellii.AAC.1
MGNIAISPRCGEIKETNDHFIACCKQDIMRQEFQQIMSNWGKINDAKQGPIAAINTKIMAIQKGNEPSPPQAVDEEIKMTFHEQSKTK